jgi:neutral ceramidase
MRASAPQHGLNVEDQGIWDMVAAVKRLLRIGLRVLAGLAVLVVTMIVFCLDGVDSRPYFRQPYYTETAARWRTCSETNSLARGELAAGFGRVRLTPKVNAAQDDPAQGRFRSMPLAGYGSRHGRPASGVHDDLYVKAVALKVQERTGVIVGADALIIPSEVADLAVRKLEEDSGLKREQIYLGATHTHCSLGAWGEGAVAESFAGGFQPAARVWFAGRIVAAVQEALGDLKPARFGYGHFAASQFIRNRLVGNLGKVDPEFCYAVVKQDGGKVAVLGVFGAHATVLSDDMMEFSADYPGYWERAVEQATGGVAEFLAGGVGSQSPVPGGRGLAGAEQMGQGLARMLIERLPETPLTNSVTFGMVGLDVTMPPLNVRLSDGVRLRPWLAAKLVPARSHSFLQVFRIDDSVWISTPCDFSGELALGIKDFLKARGDSATITSFNGDYVGYVIPALYYHLSGYEPRLMSFFGPNVPEYFDELMRTMALDLVRK